MLPSFIPSVFITLLFFLSSFEKIRLFPKSTSKFAKKIGVSLPLAQVGISGAIILEMFAPLIIYAYTFTGMLSLLPLFKMALIALIVFTVVVTALYHNPFKGKDKYYAFMSNLSTVGGLLALYIYA
jgi:uncharacterized membrane protein YphA (DoxX/SURF4 family)